MRVPGSPFHRTAASEISRRFQGNRQNLSGLVPDVGGEVKPEPMIPIRPVIDDILSKFFAAELEGTSGAPRERIEFVEISLRSYLEAEGERVLVDNDLTLLQQEREFDPDGAFARTAHADDLIFALTGYLNAVVPCEPLVLRAQLRTVERLIASVLAQRLVDQQKIMCALLSACAAIDRGRQELRHPALRRR
jgi:hypothetical protein